jgi:hypothetical protein
MNKPNQKVLFRDDAENKIEMENWLKMDAERKKQEAEKSKSESAADEKKQFELNKNE